MAIKAEDPKMRDVTATNQPDIANAVYKEIAARWKDDPSLQSLMDISQSVLQALAVLWATAETRAPDETPQTEVFAEMAQRAIDWVWAQRFPRS